MNKGKITFGKISSNFASNANPIAASGTIGTFDPGTSKPVEIENLDTDDHEQKSLEQAIGVTKFGKKTARTFDIKDMMEQVTKTAKEVTRPFEEAARDSSSSEDDDDDDDDDLIGPPIPKMFESAQSSKDADENDGSDSDTPDTDGGIPCTHHAVMLHGNKAITALSIDPSGARLASGSVDYAVSFWDFMGMDSSMKSFRTLQPCENHPIRCLSYSATGDLILVVSGAAQAKVLDRDGFEQMETVKGDMYITDQAQTKGHTSSLTSGTWNPIVRDQFLTTGTDGTARIWSLNNARTQMTVIKYRAQNGLKASPSSCVYNRDGNVLACGCCDGSLQLWDLRKSVVAPVSLVRKAHNSVEISSIRYSHLGNLLVTRSCDDTMKLWDVRNLKQEVSRVEDLYSRYDTTDALFSPDDKLVVTGTSVQKGETSGYLKFFDSTSLELKRNIELNSHVIKLEWHPKLNQIFAGTGNGIINAYYDPHRSMRGVTICTSKLHRKVKHAEIVSTQQIITPHALPLFRQERRKTSKKQMEKDRLDPIKSRRPDLPITSGQGGRLASSGGTLSSYVIRNLGLSKRVDDDQDPREAILKYAKVAEENPYWITPAYAKTQPNVLFNKGEEEGEEPATKRTKTE